jgi:uncharacterized protein YndB with AHSA1/START domain
MNDSYPPGVSVEGRQITITRVFNAPRALVFAAFTECEHLMHWWGPREWPMSFCELDLRVGGRWHYAMRSSDGQESWGLGIYDEVTPPERFVYTDLFSDAEGNVNPELPQSHVFMDFEDLGSKTRVVSVTTMATEADVETLVKMGVVPGITETWDRLEEYLAKP